MATKIAKNHRSQRAMDEKAPKLIENTKSLLSIKGPKTSETLQSILRDLHKFKAPQSKLLTKRNITRPFEDISSMEFLSRVNDSSLFSYGSHSKKRPHNLVLGRLFDHQLLDMFEFGVNQQSFLDMDAFDGIRKAVVRVGSKPCMVFQGELWDSTSDYVMLRNFLLDFFRGETLTKINLSALDRIIILTLTSKDGAAQPTLHFRHYGISLKKSSSTSLPRVELDEVGPRMDLNLRRRKSGSEDLVKASLKQPKQLKKEIHQKNIERTPMGDRAGRIHMMHQDLSNLNVARLKGLDIVNRKRKREVRNGDAADGVTDNGASIPDDNGMTDVDETPVAASAASSSNGRPRASSSSSVKKMMSGVSHNTMDEFASRSSAGSVSSFGRRESTKDKNLSRKKAGGLGDTPVEGGYRVNAKKRKTEKI